MGERAGNDFDLKLTPANLRAGMDAFRAQWKKEKDFHADFYAKLEEVLADGVTPAAWRRLVDHLFAWRACRPLRKATVLALGEPVLVRLDAERARLLAFCCARAASIEHFEWADVATLFGLAQSIKPTKSESPVFASKLCHFLLPDVMLPCDAAFAGTAARRYSEFWQEARSAWIQCSEREQLIARLARQIPSDGAQSYPWSTKIIDLCAAGALAQGRA